jgi:Xaa-Pro aminopeptidase
VSHAVEATARNLTPGRTEAEIAGEIAHRLMKHQVVPEQLQVLGDGRGQRLRHWGFGDGSVEKFCTVAAIGRLDGLCAGAVRTVSLDEIPADLQQSYQRAAMVLATGMYFSQKDWEVFEIWNRIRRIYEKCGVEDEWRMADQATIIGYEVGEIPLVPNSQYRLAAGVPVFWHPSVGTAMTGDTVLVGQTALEILTPTTEWPMLSIAVKGVEIDVPDILRRKA